MDPGIKIINQHVWFSKRFYFKKDFQNNALTWWIHCNEQAFCKINQKTINMIWEAVNMMPVKSLNINSVEYIGSKQDETL